MLLERSRRERVPARVLRLIYGLSYETVELNISKTKKEKKKEKRVHGESSSFQQRDGFVFRASLS